MLNSSNVKPIRRVWRWKQYLIAIQLAVFCSTGWCLTSQFLGSDPDATKSASIASVMAGTPYDMGAAVWRINGNINRGTFAYKLFSGLAMLGYQTEMGINVGGYSDQHLRALHAFQSRNSLPISNLVDSATLTQLDAQLGQRELVLAPIAQTFPLYGHMKPLHPNDVSKDTVAAIYALPMNVLPAYLQMTEDEMLQCVSGQCLGFIQDAAGNPFYGNWYGGIFIDPATSGYQFVGAYFDSAMDTGRQPSAVVDADTMLHEYAHYLDGTQGAATPWIPHTARIPHWGSIDTSGFYAINYDLATFTTSGCVARKSSDVHDWISYYGFVGSYNGCPAGMAIPGEEWAEAFAFYVMAGRDFRTAATQSSMVAQQYNWLKAHVFQGREYDTAMPQGSNSGCNDIPGAAAMQPGYVHCDDNYVWDFTIPYGDINGACGSSSGTLLQVAPTANLCAHGSPTSVIGSGPWTWVCTGLGLGTNANCSANKSAVPSAPTAASASAGNAQATITFSVPAYDGGSAITGYTVTSSPGGLTMGGASSPITMGGLTNGTPYTFSVVAANVNGPGTSSAASNVVVPSLSLLPTENFDSLAPPALPAGWQSVVQINANGVWKTNPGSNYPTGIAAHSGSNLVYFNSHTAGVNQSAKLIPVAFSMVGVTGAKLRFWMYRDGDASVFLTNDYVDAFINTTTSLTGATKIGTVARSRWIAPTVSTPGWYQYTFAIPPAFSGSTNYLILNGYSSGGGNDIFIDDITIAMLPDAPMIGTAASGSGSASIAFAAGGTGGSPITGFTASCVPAAGGSAVTGTGVASPIAVSGLANGVAYNCSVTATNAVGTGTASATASVTPLGADASLGGLTISAGNLSPAFMSSTTAYSVQVGNGTSSVTITPTLADSAASMTVNETPSTNASVSRQLLLNVGANVINVVVTAQNGSVISTYTLLVNRAPADQTITFSALADQPLVAASFSLSATASSGLIVSFSSTTPATCTVSGNVVTLVAHGLCSIAADQAGNGAYAAAPTVTQSFFVTAGTVPIGTRITTLPYVISAPGIYYIDQKMTTNLSTGAAIVINANNVVLDLNANAIGNLAAGLGTQAVGILADSRQNVTVRNGIVRGFYVGVALGEFTTPGASSGNAVEGVTSDQSRSVGILVEGTGSVVRHSRVVSTTGSTAIDPWNGLASNSAIGIEVTGTGAQVSDNEVINTDCTNSCTSGSQALGIYIASAPGAVLTENRILNGSLATATSSAGIAVDASSPNAFADGNYLAGFVHGLVFNGTGKYRNTLTNNVTVPYSGGTAVDLNN